MVTNKMRRVRFATRSQLCGAHIERHHSLFQLPALIKDDCAAGRFDRVVMTCSRAHEMLGAHPEGVLGRLREEVDTQIDAVCCSLRRRLADLSAPVSQLMLLLPL